MKKIWFLVMVLVVGIAFPAFGDSYSPAGSANEQLTEMFTARKPLALAMGIALLRIYTGLDSMIPYNIRHGV